MGLGEIQKRHGRIKFHGVLSAIAAAILLEEPPSIDLHEITDKGPINQRAVLTNRSALVEFSPASNPPTRGTILWARGRLTAS